MCIVCCIYSCKSRSCKSTVELTKQWIQKKRYQDMNIHPMYKFCYYSYKCAFLAFLLLCDTPGKRIGKNPGMLCCIRNSFHRNKTLLYIFLNILYLFSAIVEMEKLLHKRFKKVISFSIHVQLVVFYSCRTHFDYVSTNCVLKINLKI